MKTPIGVAKTILVEASHHFFKDLDSGLEMKGKR